MNEFQLKTKGAGNRVDAVRRVGKGQRRRPAAVTKACSASLGDWISSWQASQLCAEALEGKWPLRDQKKKDEENIVKLSSDLASLHLDPVVG